MISDQITQHESREEISHNFEHILELVPGHIYWKDLKGRLLGCNHRQARILGFASPKAMIGKSTYDLLSSNQPEAQRRQQAEAIDATDQEVIRIGKQMIMEEPQYLDDGNLRIFISQKVPLYDKHNNIIGLLGTSIDMTKQRQQELAKQEAELANETKNEFLRNMRHDIRTPFAGILGMTEVMVKEETNERKKEDLRIIAEAAEILLNYLNEILDYSHIESGVIPVLLKPFDLKQVMTQNLQALAPAATEKGLSLHSEYDKNLPEILIGDSFRIR